MITRKDGIRGLVAMLIVFVSAFIFLRRLPEPWGVPRKSPDGRFEIRYLRVRPVIDFRRHFPGDGSSGIEGYAVLYDLSANKELARSYHKDLGEGDVTWIDGTVSCNGEDGFLFELPKK